MSELSESFLEESTDPRDRFSLMLLQRVQDLETSLAAAETRALEVSGVSMSGNHIQISVTATRPGNPTSTLDARLCIPDPAAATRAVATRLGNVDAVNYAWWPLNDKASELLITVEFRSVRAISLGLLASLHTTLAPFMAEGVPKLQSWMLTISSISSILHPCEPPVYVDIY